MEKQGECPLEELQAEGSAMWTHGGHLGRRGAAENPWGLAGLRTTHSGGLGEGREASGREAFRLSGNVNFTPGYFLWDLFLGELETLPNYVWVSFKAHKLHPVLLPPS